MKVSVFRPISIGIVTENKALMAHDIKVTIPEITPFLDGELKSEPTKHEAEGIDADGNAYREEIVSDNCIIATWLPRGGNRQTPPNVRRGQRVHVYQVGDTDKYYWEYFGADDGMFRLETIVLAINNNPEVESEDTVDLSNCYYLEISTHAQHVTFQTCKSNNEPFAYTFQLNTKDGSFTITDDIDNFITLNSPDHIIRIQNTDGTWAEVNRKNINAYAPDSITMVAEKNITFQCQVFTVEAKNKVEISTPITVVSDKMSVGSDLSVGGSFTLSGGATVGGVINCLKLNSTLPITAPNV